MRIPGVLRLLILDSPSLTTQVNRAFRIKYKFRVGAVITRDFVADNPTFAGVADGFDPGRFDGIAAPPGYPDPREVKLANFLHLPVVYAAGKTVSVVELIQHFAYVEGLVHSGGPTTEHDEQLLRVRKVLQLGGSAAGLREIRAIGSVTLKALQPLRTAVVQTYRASR